MKNTDIHSKLKEIRQNASAFRLSRNVMDAKEFEKRIGRIISDLEELIEGTETNEKDS